MLELAAAWVIFWPISGVIIAVDLSLNDREYRLRHLVYSFFVPAVFAYYLYQAVRKSLIPLIKKGW